MKKTSKTNLILLFLLVILTLYLLNSKLIITSTIEYIELFITKLFPTSFLLYIISSLLINYQIVETLNIITKKPGKLYVIIMSIICGFPSGPKHTKELLEKNYISRTTANNLLKFTHFPNPLFILGSISSLLTTKLALKILFSIYISNFIISFFTKEKDNNLLTKCNNEIDFSKALNQAITSSFKLQILILGTNLFFYLISVIIVHYIKTTTIVYVFINGIFDLIKGIFSTTLISNILIRSTLILTFLSFGSLSIHIQIKSILSDTSLKYNSFLIWRIISTIISIIIFLLIY